MDVEDNAFFPTKILFGAEKLKTLHQEKLPGKRALVLITNGNSMKKYGYLDQLCNELNLAQVDFVIYNQISANPTSDEIDNGAKFAMEKQVDFIIALGGGSVIDSAKMIAIVLTNGGSIWNYTCTDKKPKTVINDPIAIIAIPTTAGTGSEVDCAGAFTYLPLQEKVAFKDERLFPAITVIDPTLTYTLPSKLTAYQGWDALTHSMENLINKNENSDATNIAKTVVKLAGNNLSKAVKNGDDQEARDKMAISRYVSGIVINLSGTTSMHALECAMSALHPDLEHGAGLIILSIAYFQFFIDLHICDEVFVEMARLLGAVDANSPDDFIKAIKNIHQKCHVDNLKMSDYLISEDEFPLIIAKARRAMPGNFVNDRYLLSDEDCLKILKQAYR